jgi:GH24 family phage-related lysozyme (muramidase)
MLDTTRAEIDRRIAINEGLRLTPYQDTMGIWTVGIGYNLEQAPRDTVCSHLAAAGCPNPAQVLDTHSPITYEVATTLFNQILPNYIAAASSSLDPDIFDALTPARQYVLVDLEYNLGQRGWLGFNHTRGLINLAQRTKNTGDFGQASHYFGLVADALVYSDWAKQVGNRALRDEACMRSSAFCSPTGDGSDVR